MFKPIIRKYVKKIESCFYWCISLGVPVSHVQFVTRSQHNAHSIPNSFAFQFHHTFLNSTAQEMIPLDPIATSNTNGGSCRTVMFNSCVPAVNPILVIQCNLY